MYLLTGLADLVRIDAAKLDPGYKEAMLRLWRNMVEKKMYLTGGIGSVKKWEGFSHDYHLPSGTDEGGCYMETCAALAVVFFAERLLQVIYLDQPLVRVALLTLDRLIGIRTTQTSWSWSCTTPYSRVYLAMVRNGPMSTKWPHQKRTSRSVRPGSR